MSAVGRSDGVLIVSTNNETIDQLGAACRDAQIDWRVAGYFDFKERAQQGVSGKRLIWDATSRSAREKLKAHIEALQDIEAILLVERDYIYRPEDAFLMSGKSTFLRWPAPKLVLARHLTGIERSVDKIAMLAESRPSGRHYVLIVEDDEDLAILLSHHIKEAGYEVCVAADGETALLTAEQTPELVLLDWNLPKKSGLEVCRRLRASSDTRHVPIIMLTERNAEEYVVRGLDTGADDYVSKPFSLAELMARMRAVRRRCGHQYTRDNSLLTAGDLLLDRSRLYVSRGGRTITLSPIQFRVLEHLMLHPGRVFSREQILDAAWGSDVYLETRSVDGVVNRLRKALNATGETDPIRTCRHAGYAFGQ